MFKILLAEDTTELQKLMAFHLKSLGAQVTVAGNGMEALRLFAAGQFDAVVTDLEMPMMNGVQLVQAIRETNTQVPIVMWSGANNPGIGGLTMFFEKCQTKDVVAFVKTLTKVAA